MPVRDMMKKGWLESTRDTSKLIDEVKDYWTIPDLDLNS